SGQFYSPGSRWEPPLYDVCSACLEGGKCPRCGSLKTSTAGTVVGYEQDFLHCLACGWDEKQLEEEVRAGILTDLVAPVWECFCQEEAERERVRSEGAVD